MLGTFYLIISANQQAKSNHCTFHVFRKPVQMSDSLRCGFPWRRFQTLKKLRWNMEIVITRNTYTLYPYTVINIFSDPICGFSIAFYVKKWFHALHLPFSTAPPKWPVKVCTHSPSSQFQIFAVQSADAVTTSDTLPDDSWNLVVPQSQNGGCKNQSACGTHQRKYTSTPYISLYCLILYYCITKLVTMLWMQPRFSNARESQANQPNFWNEQEVVTSATIHNMYFA